MWFAEKNEYWFFFKMNICRRCHNVLNNNAFEYCADCLTDSKKYIAAKNQYDRRRIEIVSKKDWTIEDFKFYFNEQPPQF